MVFARRSSVLSVASIARWVFAGVGRVRFDVLTESATRVRLSSEPLTHC